MTSDYIIEKNLCHLIGSDAHNNTKRNFCLLEAYEVLSRLVNKEYVQYLQDNSKQIIRGEKVSLFFDKIDTISNSRNKFSIIKKYIYKMLNFKDAIL